MFTVNIISIGKLKESYLRSAIDEYSKRLSSFCKFNITELAEQRLSDNPSERETLQCLDAEGKAISSLIAKGSYTVAMCIEGKMMSSEEFAELFNDIAQSGKSTVNFIIGSSFGLSDEIKKQADRKMSMSKMTFPHQLARVMLSEQIYRAFSINANMKYHK